MKKRKKKSCKGIEAQRVNIKIVKKGKKKKKMPKQFCKHIGRKWKLTENKEMKN